MDEDQRQVLFQWLLTKKCPKCGSTQKIITFEVDELDLGIINAQCRNKKVNCNHQWQIDNILVEKT